MGSLHLPEILLVALIIILVFGVGKISKIGGELGSGIKAFKDGLNGKIDSTEQEEELDQSDSKL